MTLNGVGVTTRRGGQVKRQRIGKMSRALDGSPLEEVRARKRSWRFTTDILGQTDFEKVRKLIEGLGDVWSYDADIYSAKGLDAESGAQYTMESSTGADGTAVTTASKYGGGVYISAASINIWPANVRDGDEAGTQAGFTALLTTVIAQEASVYWQESASLKVTSGGLAGDGVSVDATAIADATNYAISVYMRGINGGEAVTMDAIGDVSGSLGTKDVTLTASWQRFELVVTTPAGPGDATLELQLRDKDAGAIKFYCDGFQLEASDVVTAWVDGTRGADDDLSYDASQLRELFEGDFTVSFWAAVGDTASHGGDEQPLFSFSNSTGGVPTQGIEIAEDNGALSAAIYGGDATPDISTSGGSGVNDRTFRMVTAVFRRSPSAGESNLELLVNGVSVDTDDGSELLTASLLTLCEIGSHRSGTLQANGIVDDLVILPYALTAAEALAVYNFGVAFLDLPELRMEGDLIPESSLTVLGHALSDRLSPMNIDGVWHNNAARLEFELLEV